MIKEIEITLPPEKVTNTEAIKVQLADKLQIKVERIHGYQVIKRSIDARSRKVIYRLQVRAFIDEPFLAEDSTFTYPLVKNENTVIIVGAGPAGLFAALQCLENGLKPIVIERGKDVKQRRRDLAFLRAATRETCSPHF